MLYLCASDNEISYIEYKDINVHVYVCYNTTFNMCLVSMMLLGGSSILPEKERKNMDPELGRKQHGEC